MRHFFLLVFLFYSFLGVSQFSAPTVIDTVENDIIHHLYTVDVDNDDQKDLVIAYLYDSIAWYKNENLSFKKMSTIDVAHGLPTRIEFHDIDGNGFQDFLICDNTEMYSKVTLLKNLDGGNQWEKVIIDDSIAVGAWKSYFSDIDNDGDLDIITCGDLKVTVYLQDSGQFGEGIVVAEKVEFYNLVVSDYNNDHYPDFITNTSNGVRHYTNNQNLTFSHTNFNNHLHIFLESVDMDNDGNYDIIFPDIEKYGNLLTLKNDGNGNFTEIQSSEFNIVNATVPSLQFIDLTGNNFKDALYIKNKHYGIYYKPNNELGILNPPILIDSTYSYRRLVADDLDNDGDNDIIWFENEPFVSRRIGYILNELNPLNTSDITKAEFELFPNPVSDVLHIRSVQNNGPSNIQIYDSLGRVHFQSKKQQSFIDMKNWKPGIYYVRMNHTISKVIKTD